MYSVFLVNNISVMEPHENAQRLELEEMTQQNIDGKMWDVSFFTCTIRPLGVSILFQSSHVIRGHHSSWLVLQKGPRNSYWKSHKQME